jgi:hypothetical protein
MSTLTHWQCPICKEIWPLNAHGFGPTCACTTWTGTTDPNLTKIPIARASDPSTSHEAAESITKSGQRQTLMAQLVALVTAYPGETGGFYGLVTGIDGYWKRLSDAKNAGLIVQGAPRRWNGRNQVTWRPVEKKEETK